MSTLKRQEQAFAGDLKQLLDFRLYYYEYNNILKFQELLASKSTFDTTKNQFTVFKHINTA